MTGANGSAGPDAGPERRWDVALSFAGAQREYVGQVAAALKARGVRCFYDADRQVRLWGTNLAEELPRVYERESAVVVVFVSADYAEGDWTRLERRAAFSRAVREAGVYVLPARFDDSELPGLIGDVVTINLRDHTAGQFADLVVAKLDDLGLSPPPLPGEAGRRPPARAQFEEAATRTLPRDIASFTGRQQELRELVDAAAGAGGVVGIYAIGGMAGIGKTAFAVHAAHQLAPQFPAGQIFLPLHGHTPGRQARPAPVPAAGPMPTAFPAFADREQALAWARAERANLLACLDHVTGTGQHARIIALTAGLAGLLLHDGPWAEAITRHDTALRSAQHLGDRPGQAAGFNNRGIVRERTGDYPGAARDLEEALGICRDLGDRRGQANALTFLGDVRRVTGDYPGAARDLEEAVGICRDIGYRGGQVEALNESGTLHRVGGDLRRAGSRHQQALDLARQIGSSWDEAHALAGLGRCALATGRTAEAEDRLRHALEIFQRIGAAEADDVSAELEGLTDARPTAQGS